MNPAVAERFVRDGFVVLRGVLDPGAMAWARDRLWRGAPPCLRRDDPSTWWAPFPPEAASDDRDDERRSYRWMLRRPGREASLVRLLAGSSAVMETARLLVGPDLREPLRMVRGIYCTLPSRSAPARPPRCHVDNAEYQLGAVAYIDDVPPGGGGLEVWPGSHELLAPCFRTRYAFDPGPSYEPARAALEATPGVDLHGRAGDVVLVHHRLGHRAGVNRAATIRQAVLADFARVDQAFLASRPPPDDPWVDWSDAVQAAARA